MRAKAKEVRRAPVHPAPSTLRVLRPGVPPIARLRARLGVTQEQYARLLGVAWATVSRWERGRARPDPKAAAKLNRLRELADLIGDAIRPEDLPKFLMTPHPELRGHLPADLLENEFSFEAVKSLVLAAQSGTYR
jgi:transcriptional regulator with XRE-family HTH domain